MDNPIKQALLVAHEKDGKSGESWASLSEQYGRDITFPKIFYPWSNEKDPYGVKQGVWSHRVIKTLSARENNGNSIFDFSIDEKRSGEGHYVSLRIQDSNDYRYTLPLKIASDQDKAKRVNEQEHPRWRYYTSGQEKIYPRMRGVLHFPRAIFLSDLQKAFDEVYGA